MRKKWIKTMAVSLTLSSLLCSSVFAQGWEKVGSKWFYWLEDGTCAKNVWIPSEDGESRYWINNDGTMAVSQWIADNDVWYYADEGGNIVKNQLLTMNNGKKYWVDEFGVMARNQWITDENGNWYYMDASGAAYGRGWHNIEGEDFYFLSSGKLAVNCLVPGGGSVGADGRRINP